MDATTLSKKLMMGYQGWFACAGDGSPLNTWKHWFRNNSPDASNLTIDMWPDMTEVGANEVLATRMNYSNNSAAALYSAYNRSTVIRHFNWMRDNNLDGVMLQRFLPELRDPACKAFRDQVARNVRAGAEAFGRVFCVMYDISGNSESTLVEDLKNDWTYLVDTLRITESSLYLKHKGKPLLAIWGLGFADRPGTAAQAKEIIAYFKSSAPAKSQVTLLGGVPSNWRTLDGDSKREAEWANIYRSFDVLSPWSVGRYADDAGADNFMKSRLVPDLKELSPLGIDYMPVIFPGFSWKNLNNGPLNQVPRRGGRFWWRQLYNAISAGCTMIYCAMFDEVDEGTAMFKLVADKKDLPTQAQDRLVYLNIDGESLQSDWYLRVADQGGKMLRGETTVTSKLPITPVRRP